MKRLISLILAVALLLSLAPAVFADGGEDGGVALVFGTAQKLEQPVYNSTDKVTYYATPVLVKNTTAETVKLSAVQCYFDYDAGSFDPANIQIGAYKYMKEVTLNEPLSEWGSKETSALNGRLTVATTTLDSNMYIVLAPNSEYKLFELNLVRKNDIESGDYSISFSAPFLNEDGKQMENKVGLDNASEHISYSQSGGNLDLTDKGTITITDGALPTLDSVSMKADDEGGLDAVYGQTKKYTLTATSTKGADISDKVEWSVSPSTADITRIDNKLTVSSADVGEYTVTATPKTGECQGDAKTATFKVTPATITNPTVTISNFGKGQTIPATATMSDGLTFGTIEWKDESGTKVESGKFAGSSTYTAVITFSADGNHQLAENSTVSVSGVDSQYVTGNQLTGPDAEGKYTVTLTLKTADKEAPTVTVNSALNATYGQTLSDIAGQLNTALTASVEGSFTWVKDSTTPVGPVNGNNQFEVRFMPTDSANYATATTMVTVNVAKKQITFNRDDYKWRAINPGDVTSTDTYGAIHITYDGNEHGLEAYCDNPEIKDYVAIVYKSLVEGDNTDYDANRKATNVCSRTIKAHVIVTDPNCEFDKTSTGIETTLKIDAKVVDGTGEYEKTLPVRYNASSASITIDKFGVPNDTYTYVTSTVEDANGIIAATSAVTVDNQTINVALAEGLTDSAISKEATITLIFTARNHKTSHAVVGTTEAPFVLKLTVQITNKESRTLEVSAPASVEYGTNIEPQLVVSGQPKNAQLTFEYKKTDDNTPVAKIEEAAVGNYTVTVSCEDDVARYTGSTTFNITERSIAGATVTFGPQLTYDGNPHEQTMTVKVGGTTLTASDYELDTENGASLTQKDAGSYTVIINGKGNYTGTKEATFTIDKATPTAANFTFTPPANLTYDGNPKAASVTTTNAEIDAVTVSYAPAVPTNAGTYTVKISTAETTNYKAATNLTADDWKFTITPAEITNDMVGILGALTYTGDALTPALSVADLTAGTDYEVTYANNTNAGSASATVKGKDNYKGAVVRTFTINPANMSFAANMYVSRHTNVRTEQTITLQSITGVKGDMLTPSVTLEAPSSADNIFKVAPAYDAATGSVTFTLNGTAGSATYKVKLASPNSNYAPGEYNLVFTASHRTAIAITFEDGSATYTGSPIRYETASAGESGTWTYTYVPVVGSGASLDTDTRLPLTVGTYNVTAHFENADHIGDKTVTFTINKATPAAPAEIKVDNTDTTLGELGNKMLFEIGVPGTINWYGPDGKLITEPHNTKIEANTEYSWEFIPADGYKNNYNGIGGKTTPYVRDDLSWLPGVLGGSSSFSFHDVTRFDYYYDSVKWAADNGIASGTSRFAFSPDAVCTRAQTVTFLWRAAGSPLPRYRVSPFTDVHSYDYYYEAVLWAVEQGITTGLTATTFGPDETVTRGQVATFLYRAASAAKPNTFNPFTDVKPTAYNYGAILWAYDNRITTGTSTTTFSPDAFCTRAQIVTFLYRYYQGR